jgi:murein L,D-transpeptidase YafK
VTAGERAYELTRDSSFLDPISWNVTAWKSRHQLTVYYKGHEYRTYHAVFGRNRGNGTKLWEGDGRTPEGVYTIIEKHLSRRWEWFLGLNYPNDMDHYRYEQLRGADELPVKGGRDVGEGGHVGIHGTDNPILNSANIDWTTGCISVNNLDINELSRILPVGTVVIINP